MKELLEVIAKSLVEDPDAVQVTEKQEDEGRVTLELHVAEGDMGRVIGRQGRIAKAIRNIIKAAATRKNEKVIVDIV